MCGSSRSILKCSDTFADCPFQRMEKGLRIQRTIPGAGIRQFQIKDDLLKCLEHAFQFKDDLFMRFHKQLQFTDYSVL